MVTDPPYGVDYDPLWREEAGLGKQRQTGTVANDNRVDWAEAYNLFPGDVAYVWHAGVHAAEVARSLTTADFEIRSQIIWAKQHFAMSRGHYHWQHEPCWYAVRTGRSGNWAGSRKETTLWEIANLNPFGGDENEGDAATGHSTQKPTELMRRPIRAAEGDRNIELPAGHREHVWGVVHNLIERNERKTERHELDYRPQPDHCRSHP